MKKLRVGVIYGGRSGEHEVSVTSAAAIFKYLDRTRYEPIPIRIEKDGRWTLADRPPATLSAAEVIEHARQHAGSTVRSGRLAHMLPYPSSEPLVTVERGQTPDAGEYSRIVGIGLDVVFPILHGPYGEDGTVQGLFELANIPYVGAGVLASAVGMDKAVMKVVFAERGLPVAPYRVLLRPDWDRSRAEITAMLGEALGYPMFVKPANLGSSVGISKAKTEAALTEAIDLAFEFDRKVVVEQAVPEAREIECAVLGNEAPEASVAGEIIPSREFYDYEAKYLDAGSEPLIPAPLTDEQHAAVRRLAVEAFRAIDCAGMARVDFLLSRNTGQLYVNEINTLPGFTTISMYAKLWKASGVDYSVLLDRLIALALERHAAKQRLRTSAI
ncbi:MAG TPA: D-alanine--D-alanine ligase family protein [Vicinamibacterales bacterium]|nr:D-alanine--D-alanine ligase family protein [Vicinamibacterales bacterium]